MATSAAQVTDERSLPGTLEHSLPATRWARVDGAPKGCLALFLGLQQSGTNFRENVAVIVTRFVFDHGVDPADLVDHAFVDARSLTGWHAQLEQRWPIKGRHSGWALQSGTYVANRETLFVASTYSVYERGNVGYLFQTTGTLRDEGLSSTDRTEFIDKIKDVTFVD